MSVPQAGGPPAPTILSTSRELLYAARSAKQITGRIRATLFGDAEGEGEKSSDAGIAAMPNITDACVVINELIDLLRVIEVKVGVEQAPPPSKTPSR